MIIVDYIFRYSLTVSLIANVITNIFKSLTPIFAIIMVITIVNILYRYSKYGSKILPKFKSPKIDDYQQNIMINSINKLGGNRKVISLTNCQSDLLIIDEKGIYLLLYYNEHGTLIGHITDQKLKLKKSEYVFTEVINPFQMILEDEIKLLKIIGEIPINKYIIFNNNCNVQVEDISNVETLLLRNSDHILKSELKKVAKKSIDVEEYYNKITLKIGN
ncbi:MAG: hypothetical protein PHW32_00890 [Bacilli bacterium]|nr:hypothetical protein [Bacilli bacterium]MDD4282998.1 hypothetical protein [Bacilli bacterium]